MIKEEAGHDGDGDAVAGAFDDANDFLVFETDDVLAVDFEEVVIGQQAVAGRRRVLDQADHLAVLQGEADVAEAVLVQRDRPLERPVRNFQRKILLVHSNRWHTE